MGRVLPVMIKRKKPENSNLKLAGLFVVLVLSLIILSILFKFFLIVKTSKFDGTHNFIVSFIGQKSSRVVAFSPQGKSLSILDINSSKDLTKLLEIPVDGKISIKEVNDKIPPAIFGSIFSLGKPLSGLTILDALRLFIFSETVSANNVKERELSPDLNAAQQSTLISLSFSDPSVYQENQSVQIINAAGIYGIGGRLAALVTNIGGNVVLISTSDEIAQVSKIVYYGNKSYTVKKLSDYLGFKTEKSDKRGMADVIITIGKDGAGGSKF
jgi:hypothetical protein